MAVRLGRRLSQPQLNAGVNVGAETDGLHLSPLGSVVLGRRLLASASTVFASRRGLRSLTAQQMASNVGARHVYGGCERVGQGLGHILKEQGPFDLVFIMAGTNDLGGSAHPVAITQDVLALHGTCHRAGVRTVILPVHPNSGTNREVPRCHLYASRWESLNLRLEQNCCSDYGYAAFVGTSKIVSLAICSNLMGYTSTKRVHDAWP